MKSAFNPPAFHPLIGLSSGWVQTIAGRYWPQLPDIKPDKKYLVELEDGDQLAIHDNAPRGKDAPESRIILMVHGLAGCYQSSYMKRMTRKLSNLGYRVVRINLRGCGPGEGLARRPYHSGRSEDLRAVLNFLAETYQSAHITLVGFSLGANIVLKLVGEDGQSLTANLDSAVAVSPPADLAASSKRLTEKQNKVFDRYFVKALKAHVLKLHDRFPELESADFPKEMTLTDFDELYTAPRSGFLNAIDYYSQSSSALLLSHIQCPTLLLTSLDDPVVDSAYLNHLPDNPCLDTVITQRGGHVAFLGWTGRSFRWMDEVIVDWLSRFEGSKA